MTLAITRHIRHVRAHLASLLAVALATACSAPHPGTPRDPYLAQYARAGELAVQAGDLREAIRWYRSARDRAREMDAPLDVARQAHNLAVILSEAGEWDLAQAAATEARTHFAGDPSGIAASLGLLAKIAEHQGQDERAIQLAREGLSFAQQANARAEDATLRLVLARAALRRGDFETAEKELHAISRKAMARKNALLQAEWEDAQAAWAQATGRLEEAARRRDAQAACYRMAGRFDAMADALEQAATAFEKAGLVDEAALRYFRAARSQAGAGQPQAAQDLLSRAERLAAKANLVTLQSSIAALAAELAIISSE